LLLLYGAGWGIQGADHWLWELSWMDLEERSRRPPVPPPRRRRGRSWRHRLGRAGAVVGTVLVRHPADLTRLWTVFLARRSGATPLTAHLPLLPFAAVDYLESRICPASAVFEYGSGGSTLWLAERAGSVMSVEHDAEWYSRVAHELESSGLADCTLLLRTPETSRCPDAAIGQYASAIVPASFHAYARAIDPLPDGSLDLVLVDGRARVACLRHAAPKVRPGGLLVLDDSDRPRYQVALAGIRDWPRVDLSGLRPFRPWLGTTTCLERPAAWEPEQFASHAHRASA
jgi:hypothetical protein